MMRLALLLIAFLCVGAFLWLLFGEHSAEVPLEELREELPAPRSVSFERSYEDGVLAIAGDVSTLDECETVSATATLSGSTARVLLSVPPTEGPCLARASTAAFSVDLAAPEDATVEFLVNGLPARATEL